MDEAGRLLRSFFAQPTLLVARSLLGARLVRLEGGQRLAGYIIETEAYIGEDDLGCHARVGRTPRTQVMYGPPGHAYVYFTYGMHWMLNFVTQVEDFPAAVLIRAILPTEGLELIASRRSGRPQEEWTNGPGKICQALSIGRAQNGADLCDPQTELFVEVGLAIPEESVTIGPRVGLNSVPEPWKSIPWRFRTENPLTTESTEHTEKFYKRERGT
jgi:DNA-3-methyladenine glycosylase